MTRRKKKHDTQRTTNNNQQLKQTTNNKHTTQNILTDQRGTANIEHQPQNNNQQSAVTVSKR